MRLLTALALVLALGGRPAPARADVQSDKAKAIALFDAGIKNLKAGNYDKACKELAASNALVPDSGTRGSLARCYTKLGKLASAWMLWRELSDTAPTADLRADAAAQAKKLDPRLSRYVVKIQGTVPGFAMTLDGRPIDPTIDVPTPIDPGKYRVEASAPGFVAWQGEATVGDGKTTVIEVPKLARVTPARDDKPRVVVKKAGAGRRIVGVSLGVIGVGGIVAGGVFGLKARSLNDDAKQLCGGAIDQCPADQLDAAQAKVDDARAAATISTIAFAAGGVAVVTGIVLFVTAPRTEQRTVTIAPTIGGGAAGLAISSSF